MKWAIIYSFKFVMFIGRQDVLHKDQWFKTN